MIKQEYVDKETVEIKKQGKHANDICTSDLLKMMILITVVFFCTTSLHGYEPEWADQWVIDDGKVYNVDEGRFFRCGTCGTNQWKAKCMADWRGDYYCTKCKRKL